MCRVLGYLGKQEVPLKDLIFLPDNSLIRQSYNPRHMRSIQNLAGFGMTAWSDDSNNPKRPYHYKTEQPPFFDKNLSLLADKINTKCLLAHVRGVSYNSEQVVSAENAHPFMYENYTLAMAHNGSLANIFEIKPLLYPYLNLEVLRNISGVTDSEWIYCILMSQFDDPTADITLDEAWDAVIKTFKIIRDARKEAGTHQTSPVNLFVTNGEYIIVTRFAFDFGAISEDVDDAFLEYHSLWYTFGETYGVYDGIYKMHGKKRSNILFSSEPLTMDTTTWIELPEYSITKAWMEDDEFIIRTAELNV